MTPTNARKAKSTLPKPHKKADTSDTALSKNKKIKNKNKNRNRKIKNKNKKIIGKEFYSCQIEEKQPKRKTVEQPKQNRVKSSNQLGRCGRKRPKMDENRVFPTNQVNMDLFSIDGNFIKKKFADQKSNVTTAATQLFPSPFDNRTSGPPLPVPRNKWSPKIWSPWTNDPQPIDGNYVKIKVADQESNVTMVSCSGTKD